VRRGSSPRRLPLSLRAERATRFDSGRNQDVLQDTQPPFPKPAQTMRGIGQELLSIGSRCFDCTFRMPTIAGKLQRPASIVTIVAAVLLALVDWAIARWVCALLDLMVGHGRPPIGPDLRYVPDSRGLGPS
jgi:hypothetical protein